MLRLGLMFSGKHPVGNSRMGIVNASRKGRDLDVSSIHYICYNISFHGNGLQNCKILLCLNALYKYTQYCSRVKSHDQRACLFLRFARLT